MNPFALFVYLQLMDLFSTIAALMHGNHEMNPIVRWVMGLGHYAGQDPFLNLALLKFVGITIGYFVYRQGNYTWAFHGLNWIFAVVVAMNVLGMI